MNTSTESPPNDPAASAPTTYRAGEIQVLGELWDALKLEETIRITGLSFFGMKKLKEFFKNQKHQEKRRFGDLYEFAVHRLAYEELQESKDMRTFTLTARLERPGDKLAKELTL